MGCDIHLYVEKKVDGKWQFQGKLTENDCISFEGPSFYDGRNYNLFAILADVRNCRGFAGIKTGKGFNPISDPRGFPEDASAECKALVESWDCDGHSHSYHTLRQLLNYDWTQSTTLQGWCSMVEWERWSRWDRKQGKGPDSYCGMVSGESIEHITAEEADALFKGLKWDEREQVAEQNANKYALAVWSEPYYEAAGSFMNETIPRLLALAESVDHVDDVRIVFFFDN